MKSTRILVKKLQLLCITMLILSGLNAEAQPKAAPGVQYIMVNFASPPSIATVTKTVLRYNKDFALSFHTDDGFQDVYTVGFQFFTGINESGNSYPGLFYTDGCGNDISFKLSNSVFSFSGYNNEDMHQPGNGYGAVSWPQLATMYLNGCSINNHGFTSDAFTEPDYMHYTIRRNESFIRRRLLSTVEGGVKTRIFVNPNGATPYTDAAFAAGYRAALRMGAWGVIPNEGLDIGTFNNWNQPLELNRNLAESTNVKQMADNYAEAANNNSHFWMPLFTHRIIEDYPQASFFSDFNYIADNYGKNGTDKVWMTTEEEIIDYQIVRQLTTVNHVVTGNVLLITLSGDLPTDLRHYALSLLVEADANISSVNIIGGAGHSYNGTGTNSSLINLSWEGAVTDDLVALAETNVSWAEQHPTQYNGLIAMDYVLMLPAGPIRDGLRDRLCALNGINYEQGFCVTCSIDLGPDLEVCNGNCITITAPEATGNSYLWSNGQTTASILHCPLADGSISVQVTDINGCVASDTIHVGLLPAMVFELGDDVNSCPGDTVTITGPENPDYNYQWFVDGVEAGNNPSLQILATDTMLVKLHITNPNGCISSDSLNVYVREQPLVEVLPDTAILCIGQSAVLQATAQFADSFVWYDGSSSTQLTFEATEAGTFHCWFRAVNGFGCSSADTSVVIVHPLPDFNLSVAGNQNLICAGTSATIQVDILPAANVEFLVWNNTETQAVNGQSTIQKTFTFTENTTINVKAISDGNCSTTKSLEVVVSSLPSITMPDDMGFCSGDTLNLTASGGVSCAWYLGGQQIGNGWTIEITPVETAYYKAIVTGAAPAACSNSDSVLVTHNPSPQINIQASQSSLCKGKFAILTAGGAQSYLWDNGTTTPAITVQPEQTTTYHVTGISAMGCSGEASVSITVYPVPAVVLEGLLPVYCQTDAPSTLTGIPEGGFFTGGSLNNNVFDPSAVSAGNHTIYYQLTTEDGCVGIDSASALVIAFDKTIDLGEDKSICPHETLLLDAGEGFDAYYWSTGQSSRQLEIQGTMFIPGTLRTISVAGVLNGCVATDAIQLSIRSDCYIGQDEVNAKKPFTVFPNPANGSIGLVADEELPALKLCLFELSGREVWHSGQAVSLAAGAHYTFDVKNVKPGVYILQVDSSSSKRFQLKIVLQ